MLERLTEKRMSASAMEFYASQTEADIDAERISVLGDEAEDYAKEARATEAFHRIVAARQSETARSQTTSLGDCVTMYVLVRLAQPQTMVETGVFMGAMTAMALEAMTKNARGILHSIDLKLAQNKLDEELYGSLVAVGQRERWNMIFGDSRVELPRLLNELGAIDVFNHDSLHTTEHMLWEYELAWSAIRSGGWLASHDVLTTPAWKCFTQAHQDEISDEGRVFGLGFAIKRS